MSNDYRLNLLSEELDKYKAVVLKLTEENERLKATHLQLQSSELKQHLEKVNCERGNYELHKALEEIRVICKQGCNNCKHNKDDITCSYGDCGEGKIILIEEVINEVLKDGNEL